MGLAACMVLWAVPSRAHDWDPTDNRPASTAWEFISQGIEALPGNLPIAYFIDANGLMPTSTQVSALQDAARDWTDIPPSRIAFAYQGFSLGPFTSCAGVVLYRRQSGSAGTGMPLAVGWETGNPALTGFRITIHTRSNYLQEKHLHLHEIGHGLSVGHGNGLNRSLGDSVMDYNGSEHVLGPADVLAASALHPQGNRRPVARLAASPSAGASPLFVTLDASASRDPEEGPLVYRFDFGDGTNLVTTSPSVTHAYHLPAGSTSFDYHPTVMVGDEAGGIDYKIGHVNGVPSCRVRVMAQPDLAPPPVPDGFIATPADGSVRLQWGSVTDISMPLSYVVHRRSSPSGTYSPRAVLVQSPDPYTPPPGSFVDDLVVNGCVYEYYLTVRDAWGNESAPSPVRSAQPRSAVPQAPTISPCDNRAVREGESVEIVVRALDANGDPLFLQMENLDGLGGAIAWAWNQERGGGASGALSVTPTAGFGGNYRFRFTAVDSTGLSATRAVNVSVQPRWDLSAALYGDTRGWPGESRTQRVLVANQGFQATPPTLLKVHRSPDAMADASDELILERTVPSLAPGAQAVFDFPVPVPGDWIAPVLYVVAEVDPDGIVAEGSESNNRAVRGIGLSPSSPSDVDGSGICDLNDLLLVLEAYQGGMQDNSCADINGDGLVDVSDVLLVLEAYAAGS